MLSNFQFSAAQLLESQRALVKSDIFAHVSTMAQSPAQWMLRYQAHLYSASEETFSNWLMQTIAYYITCRSYFSVIN